MASATVWGANDGIVSTASLGFGFAGAGAAWNNAPIACGGGIGMAAGARKGVALPMPGRSGRNGKVAKEEAMRTMRWSGAIVALGTLSLALGSACAPTTHANSVAVTYYYMPG